MKENDWIYEFNHRGHYVYQFKYHYMGQCPWDIDCDYKKCYEDWPNNYDKKENKLEQAEYWGT